MTTTAGERNPPVLSTAVEAWRYAFAGFSCMPILFGTAMLAVFVLNALTLPFAPGPKEDPTAGIQLLGLAVTVVQGFLLAPVAIAVHRFVLLGELTAAYRPDPSDRRFMTFFVFSAVFQLMMDVPATLMAVATKSGGAGGGVLAFVFFVAMIVAVIVALRVLILFPAIAVDAPGARWRNAYFDTKGHTWRVFGISVLTALPALLVALPLYFVIGWPEGIGLVGGALLAIVQSAVSVLMIAALAAAASRLFAAYNDRLNE